MTDESLQSESDHRYPPRYWWTKRLFAALVILVALLGCLRLAWGSWANRQLARAIEQVKSRGEPILPADFNAPNTVPDSENVAWYLKEAIAAIDSTVESPAQSNLEYRGYPPFPPEWYALARKAIPANKTALDLVRQARQHQRVHWGHEYSSPVLATFPRHLNDSRNLANIVADAALWEHLHRNDDQALEHVADLLDMADAFTQRPSLIELLVGTGIEALAVDRLGVMSPGLQVSSTNPARNKARELTKRLLAQDDAKSIELAIYFERMAMVDTIACVTHRTHVIHPGYTREKARVVETYGSFAKAVTRPLYSDAVKLLGPKPAPTNDVFDPRVMQFDFEQSVRHVLELNHRRAVNRRNTAVSGAARMYQLDHEGRWPASLDALVPDYLPAVPVDPFSPTGAPLRYLLAREGTRPVVYSVGPDGQDDTKNESVLPPEPQFMTGRGKDIWQDLSRFDPPPERSDHSGQPDQSVE